MFKKSIASVATAAIIVTSALVATAPAAFAGHFKFHSNVGFHGSACTPFKAVRTARFFGVRNAHVVRFNDHKVVVKGFRHNHVVRVVFANEHGCPIIRL